VGVGALGGVFAAGVSSRLGGGLEAASRLLAGPHAGGVSAAGTSIPPHLFRQAIERSLVPVFVVLLALAAINLFLAGGFPRTAGRGTEEPEPAEGLV